METSKYSPRYYSFDDDGSIEALYASRFILLPCDFLNKLGIDNIGDIFLSKNKILQEEISHHFDLRFSPTWHPIHAWSILSRLTSVSYGKYERNEDIETLLILISRRWILAILQYPIIETVGKWRTQQLNISEGYDEITKSTINSFLKLISDNENIESNVINAKNCALQDALNIAKSHGDLSNTNIIDNGICNSFINHLSNTENSSRKNEYPPIIYIKELIKYVLMDGVKFNETYKTISAIGSGFWKPVLKRSLSEKSTSFHLPGIWTYSEEKNDFEIFDPEASQVFLDKRTSDNGAESRFLSQNQDNLIWCRILVINIFAHKLCEYHFLGNEDRRFLKFISMFLKISEISSFKVIPQITELAESFSNNSHHNIIDNSPFYKRKKFPLTQLSILANELRKANGKEYLAARLYYVHGI